MNAFYERANLGAIEINRLLGRHDLAHIAQQEYDKETSKGKIRKCIMFEGIIEPIGINVSEKVVLTSISKIDNNDLLLTHKTGRKFFSNFLNKKVQIWGEEGINSFGERFIYVYKIVKIKDRATFLDYEDSAA